MSVDESVKRAAEQVESEHPGAHVVCVAIVDGVIYLNAKSTVINDKLDAAAALWWVAEETAKTTRRDVAAALAPKSRKKKERR